MPEAELLINVTNDAWFGDTIAPHQHLQIARTRALETGRYLVRAANTGMSAIIDSKGNVLSSIDQHVEGVVIGNVYPMRGITPFIIWGNLMVVIIAWVTIFAHFIYRRKYRYH